MASFEKVQCINCDVPSEGNFCSVCGQRKNVMQLKWTTLADELNQRFIGLDNKFARTVRDLTVRPEAVVDAFIKGNRVRYVGPVGYYFVLITLYVLLLSILSIDVLEFYRPMNEAMMPGGHPEEASQAPVQKFMLTDMKLMSFLMMPFFILAVYLIFRNKKYNIIETSVNVFYIFAHPTLLYIAGLLLYRFAGINLVLSMVPVGILYLGYVCARFYAGNKVWLFVKGVLTYLLGMIFFGIFFALVGIVLAKVNPDLAKSLIGR